MTNKSHIPKPVSPASAGSAGAHFEARVGAYYFLTMVAGGEPRGLPGTSIKSVALQQRMADHPLDDVVVYALDASGNSATLEIQAKRSMTFTASDGEFADVVSQIWAASQKPEFVTSRYELAAAISRTTTRIEQEIQDVLHWARVHGDAASFHADIRREGFGSARMRDFVKVFRENLTKCGAPEGDETVWRLLRRFQVLVFDLEAEGSSYEYYARERCRMVLAADQAGRASDLWARLIVEAGSVARAAGSRSRLEIVESFAAEDGYHFAPERVHQTSFDRLEEEAHLALKDVDDQIGGARLSRTELIEQGSQALIGARILNITGAPGSGKTMVLKRLVALSAAEGRVIVLRGGRIVGGGWLQFAATLGTTSTARDFLTDLASAGGATLFVDNIDQIDDPRERQTIADLLEVGASSPGWHVVVTSSNDRSDWTTLLPQLFRGDIVSLMVPPISDAEAADLSEQNSTIANLLRPDHPARGIARNLFYLARLVSAGSANANSLSTELDLARLWWDYAGGRSADDGRFARLRAMRKMANEALAHPGRPATKTDDLESRVVGELLRLDVIREEVPGAEVSFRHDVLRDWTIGFAISENPEILRGLPKNRPVATAIVRGVELAARLVLDADATGERWRGLLNDTSGPDVHGSWRRPILLALPRSEKAMAYFDALTTVLFACDGALLGELVRLLLVVDSIPIADVFARLKPDFKIPDGAANFVYPKGASWPPTIMWLSEHLHDLPPAVFLDAAKAFMAWLMLTSGLGVNLPENLAIVGILFEWLDRLDEASQPRFFGSGKNLPALLNIPHQSDAREHVRMAAFSFAQVNVESARLYLAKLNQTSVHSQDFESIIKGRGALAKAAPKEFADYFMAGIVDPESEQGSYASRYDHGPFNFREHIFLNPNPAQGPMLEMLQTAPTEGLALVRRIVEHATDWRRRHCRRNTKGFPRFSVPFTWGEQSFEGDGQVYQFARSGMPSSITTSALMALEAWSHQRLEAGDVPEAVLRDIIGPEGGSIAFIAVAADVVLSHWPKFVEIAWPLVATPQVIKLDDDRFARDAVGVDNFNQLPDNNLGTGPTRAELQSRPSRRARLIDMLPHYVLSRREDLGPKVRAALKQASQAISAPEPDLEPDPLNSLYAIAQRTTRMADPANWKNVLGRREDGSEVSLVQYEPEEDEQQLIETRSIEVNASIHRAVAIASIHMAFRDNNRATPQVVADAIAWAQAEPSRSNIAKSEEAFVVAQARRAVLMAAVLAVRHATGQDRTEAIAWAKRVFSAAVQAPDDDTYHSPHIEYDAKSIAAAGMINLYVQSPEIALHREILELATNPHASVANAIATGFPSLKVIDQAFLRSILRLFIVTASYICSRYDEDSDKLQSDHAKMVEHAIDAELVWLKEGGEEPDWPAIAPWHIRSKPRIRFPGPGVKHEWPRKKSKAVDLCADEMRLGMISSHLVGLTVGERPKWLIKLTQHLLNWAIEANGPDEDGHNANGRPFTFNASFFDFLGILAAALPHDDAVTLLYKPMRSLADEAFAETIATFLRGFDFAVNSTDATKPNDLFALRNVVGARLKHASSYRRLAEQKSFSCEMHLGNALCAMFYQSNRVFSIGAPLPPWPPSNFAPAMPMLTATVTEAPTSGYIAVLFIDLVEVAPSNELSPFVLEAAQAWAKTYGEDTSFWNNNDIGARVSAWFTTVAETGGLGLTDEQQNELRVVLDVMVRAGVTSARTLEDLIDTMDKPDG